MSYSFEGIDMPLQKGDVVTSKKGWLVHSDQISDVDYLCFKAQYVGKGRWIAYKKQDIEKATKVKK